ncbi:MAG: hypothetical protein COA57_01860 [Flavobacteriales bacterium]|nr:MAG: hypothetical protein COA57_01860 [Flavobacteriales bacterium]
MTAMTGFAQQTERDVVYLKNGSIIKGKIIEMELDGNIKIETMGGSIFVYKMEEVKKIAKESVEMQPPQTNIAKEEPPAVEPEPYFPEPWEPMKNGFFIYIGNGFILSGEGAAPFDGGNGGGSISFINGYQFKYNYSVGLGINMEIFSNLLMMPIFLDTRYTLLKKKTSPIIYAQTGYTTPLTDNAWNGIDSKGGFTFEAGIGMKRHLKGSANLVFSAGYRHQEHNYTRTDCFWDQNWNCTEIDTEVVDIFNRATIRIGFMF